MDIVQITDLHLSKNKKNELHNINTYNSAKTVIEYIAKHEKSIDYLITGKGDYMITGYYRAKGILLQRKIANDFDFETFRKKKGHDIVPDCNNGLI